MKLLDALDRLGGMVVRPRETLGRILHGEGSLYELLPWVVVAAVAAAPRETGQALLIARLDQLAGIGLVGGVIANRMGSALLGAFIGAALIFALGRIRGSRDLRFDRTLDAAVFCLVPYLGLAGLGALLSALGYELWFMPHRLLRGHGTYLATRAAVSFLWPLLLYSLLVTEILRAPTKESPS